MLDSYVGQLLDEVKKQGIYDESLILFTSDHGEMLGSHGLFQKMCMYEEAAKVPLFLKFPKGFIPVQKEINRVVSHVDVLPTLCDYLKIKPSNKMDGESWLPLLSGKVTDDGEGTAFLQYDGCLLYTSRCV